MKRILWVGSIVVLFCLTLFSLRNAYATEPAQESTQVMVEVMIFKVELGPQNTVGLMWGKDGEMRKKDSSMIVDWLKKQGELTLLCNQNFYTENGKETTVRTSFTIPMSQSSVGQPKSVSYQDLGSTVRLTPRIQNNEISMIINLECSFLLGSGGLGRYSTQTSLHAEDGKTLVIDGGATDQTENKASKTALVVLITPHIVK